VTLHTNVYVLDEISPQEVFDFCQEHLIKPDKEPVTYDREDKRRPGEWCIGNQLGQGFDAILMIYYRKGVPLLTKEESEACGPQWYCDEVICTKQYHGVACWLEVNFDTAYSYHDDKIGSCGALHARYIFELGEWLDDKGVAWGWRNEFTGDKWFGEDRYRQLSELTEGGAQGSSWFNRIVMPAIKKMGYEPIGEENP
jgi:hypothetical protein